MYRLSTNLRITVIFSLRVDGVRGVVRSLKGLDLRYVYKLHSSILRANLIHIQASEPFSPRLLHLPCASYNTNHCRGCFKPTRCPPNCSGGQLCPVRTCCPSVCAIALFEVLSSFDKEYAGFVAQNSPTGKFINVVIARRDKRTRGFEGRWWVR